MPAKPRWISRLPAIIAALEAGPDRVPRSHLEGLLSITPRRAQQIMAPCIAATIGTSGLADRARLIDRLHDLASGNAVHYEQLRRRKLAEALSIPRLLVEAPASIAGTGFSGLPNGITIEPGKITIEAPTPATALELLLALAMAIGNDLERFDRLYSC